MKMNTLYVTVSVPLLLILAGFNHAHGLTTFGKTNQQGNNNQANAESKPLPKLCSNNTDCRPIKGTSCVKDPNNVNTKELFCLCGDNDVTDNGKCTATKKAPQHTCNTSEECVTGAMCEASKKEDGIKICICTNNPEYYFNCNGAPMGNIISGLALVLMMACRIIIY